jgi:ferrous iron transport protein B
MSTAFDAVVLVLNAAQLDRQLPLAMQILASGLPAVWY